MTVHSSRNNGEKTGKRMPPVEHQFKPGNPGRPKGSRNKLGEAFIEDLHIAWEKHGMAAIEATIKNQPGAIPTRGIDHAKVATQLFMCRRRFRSPAMLGTARRILAIAFDASNPLPTRNILTGK